MKNQMSIRPEPRLAGLIQPGEHIKWGRRAQEVQRRREEREAGEGGWRVFVEVVGALNRRGKTKFRMFFGLEWAMTKRFSLMGQPFSLVSVPNAGSLGGERMVSLKSF